jgi:hypothetical protein
MVISSLVQFVSSPIRRRHTFTFLIFPDQRIVGEAGKPICPDLKWQVETTGIFKFVIIVFVDIVRPKPIGQIGDLLERVMFKNRGCGFDV